VYIPPPGGGGVTRGTVANAPACNAGVKGLLYVVTDADGSGDCTVGSGSDVNDCICDGTGFVDVDNASGGGAPTDSQYWTGAANGTLSAEIVVNSEASLQTAVGGINLLVETEIDASSELAALMDDETGTSLLVFNTSPTIVTPTLTLQDGNGAAPTTDGQVKYDRTTERLQVGDGSGTQEIYPGDHAGALTTHIADTTSVHGVADTTALLQNTATATAFDLADATQDVSGTQWWFKTVDDTIITDFVDSDGDHSEFTTFRFIQVSVEHDGAGITCDRAGPITCRDDGGNWIGVVGSVLLCSFSPDAGMWVCTMSHPTPVPTPSLETVVAVGNEVTSANSLNNAVCVGNNTTGLVCVYVDGGGTHWIRACDLNRENCTTIGHVNEPGSAWNWVNDENDTCLSFNSTTYALTVSTTDNCADALTVTGNMALTGDQSITGGQTISGNSTVSGELRGLCTPTVVTAASHTQVVADCVIVNGDADALEVDLQATPTGKALCFFDNAGGAITLDPNGTDAFRVSGLSPSAGEAIVLASGVGNNVCVLGLDANTWLVFPGTGALTEETP
jgi:hypothetical protein